MNVVKFKEENILYHVKRQILDELIAYVCLGETRAIKCM